MVLRKLLSAPNLRRIMRTIVAMLPIKFLWTSFLEADWICTGVGSFALGKQYAVTADSKMKSVATEAQAC